MELRLKNWGFAKSEKGQMVKDYCESVLLVSLGNSVHIDFQIYPCAQATCNENDIEGHMHLDVST
jgi:hypothetical protein